MKIEISILLLISSAIIGCSKKNDSECENPADSITYSELNPTVQITSVDSLIYHISGCGPIPSPSDSTASVSFDINNDGLDDFTLSCSSWTDFVSASQPCANYNTRILLSGTSNLNSIGIIGNYNVVKRYVSNEVIDNSQQWSNTASIMLSSASAPFSTDFNDTAYLGLKINTIQGAYFGWMYIDKNGYDVTVISHGLNQSANCPINAGQKE